MSPGATFERVYLALKDRLAKGGLAPGEHLEPAMLGRELNSSITPVRDALHRLVGERMIEAPRHNGFLVPLPSEAELRDLYAWNLILLELALRRPARAAAGRIPGALRAALPAEVGTADRLFREIGRSAAGREHAAAIASVNDRLGPVRVAERKLLAGIAEEEAELCRHYARRDLPLLRRSLARYHRRRQRHVDALVASMRTPPS